MNGHSALCLMAAFAAIIACILFYEARQANTGPDYQAYERYADTVKRHNKPIEEAAR